MGSPPTHTLSQNSTFSYSYVTSHRGFSRTTFVCSYHHLQACTHHRCPLSERITPHTSSCRRQHCKHNERRTTSHALSQNSTSSYFYVTSHRGFSRTTFVCSYHPSYMQYMKITFFESGMEAASTNVHCNKRQRVELPTKLVTTPRSVNANLFQAHITPNTPPSLFCVTENEI